MVAQLNFPSGLYVPLGFHLGPTEIFLVLYPLLFDCSTIFIFHSLSMKYFIPLTFLIIYFIKLRSAPLTLQYTQGRLQTSPDTTICKFPNFDPRLSSRETCNSNN